MIDFEGITTDPRFQNFAEILARLARVKVVDILPIAIGIIATLREERVDRQSNGQSDKVSVNYPPPKEAGACKSPSLLD